MKLLAATTRYYLVLNVLLFGIGGIALYYGINWALRTEISEQLAIRRQELLDKARTNSLPPVTHLETLLDVSRTPRPEGFRDTILPDNVEHSMVPHRLLTFPLTVRGAAPVWVTLQRSMVEAEDLIGIVLSLMLGVLALLLGGVVMVNRWYASHLWAPFRHTLEALRSYDLQQHQPLKLATPAIAEFAELNHALTVLSQRLVADYETLREFTANAAHETQTPLAIMQAQLEQLLQLPVLTEDASAAPLITDLYGATLRLSRLHQALSLLSKIENRQFARAVPLRLDQLLREKIAQFEALFDARELRYGLDIATGPIVQTMHPGLADSLLHNLLQNAVKHNVRGGEIAIKLSPQGLKVSNTGPTVQGDPARFFERFRKHNAASESPGLGLSIVQQIAGYYSFEVAYTVSNGGTRHTLHVEWKPAAGPPARKAEALRRATP